MDIGFNPKYIYDTNEKVKKYVDHYCSTYGGHHQSITVEEALTHKLVQEQIQYYLNNPNQDEIKVPDFIHDYN